METGAVSEILERNSDLQTTDRRRSHDIVTCPCPAVLPTNKMGVKICELISGSGRILHIKMLFLIEVAIFSCFKTNKAVIRSHYGIMMFMKLFELVRAGALTFKKRESYK